MTQKSKINYLPWVSRFAKCKPTVTLLHISFNDAVAPPRIQKLPPLHRRRWWSRLSCASSHLDNDGESLWLLRYAGGAPPRRRSIAPSPMSTITEDRGGSCVTPAVLLLVADQQRLLLRRQWQRIAVALAALLPIADQQHLLLRRQRWRIAVASAWLRWAPPRRWSTTSPSKIRSPRRRKSIHRSHRHSFAAIWRGHVCNGSSMA